MARRNHRVLLDDCDAAGVVFGPRLLALAHQTYETVLAELGIDFAALIRGGELALPYVHLDCEFRAPLRHGETVTLDIACARLGSTSYTIEILVARADGTAGARITQTHVALDPRVGSKIPLPEILRTALTTLVPCAT
jgi:4-hydroxybenzoyl-CoA thioesterase